MTDASSIYQRARADVAAMLGYDLDNLTPEQATRLDVSTALRVLLDNQSARLCRGESLDARELLMASEALSRLLPPLREPVPDTNREDPRDYMWRTYCEMRARGAAFGQGYDGALKRIAELEAKVAELEAALAVSGADVTIRRAAPAADNVVPMSRTPSAPSKPAPPAPATGIITDNEPEPWRPFVGGGAHYDRWGNHN